MNKKATEHYYASVDQAAAMAVGNQPEAKQALKKPSSRAGWNSGLKQEELEKPGGILLAMLTQHANELGHSLTEMAAQLNVTYAYIAQLRAGVRKVAHISDEFVSASALYLGVPRLTVLLAAGRLHPQDVYENPHEAMAEVPHALQFLRSDAKYGPMMPPEVFEASLNVQFFIVKLYEAATKRALLPGYKHPEALAKQIDEYQQYREKLCAEVEAARQQKSV